MSEVTDLFEKISHPTRVKILKLLDASPLNFSQLKNRLGIESSGNLDHHLKKLEGLVFLDSDGLYKVPDSGKEALRAIKSIETSLAAKETYPVPQSRRIFGVLLILLAIFIVALTIVSIAMIPESMTSQGLIGLVGGLIGSLVGMLSAGWGLKRAIMADSKSIRQVAYFPSQKDPWMIGDWIVNLFFFSSYLTLLFSLIYAQVFSTNFPYKPLWYMASIFALSTFFIASLAIGYRIIEKANKKIEQVAQS